MTRPTRYLSGLVGIIGTRLPSNLRRFRVPSVPTPFGRVCPRPLRTSIRRNWPRSMRRSTHRPFRFDGRRMGFALAGIRRESLRKSRPAQHQRRYRRNQHATAVGVAEVFCRLRGDEIPIFSEKMPSPVSCPRDQRRRTLRGVPQNNDLTWRCPKLGFAGSRSTSRSR